jgi:hypothetical protein
MGVAETGTHFRAIPAVDCLGKSLTKSKLAEKIWPQRFVEDLARSM